MAIRRARPPSTLPRGGKAEIGVFSALLLLSGWGALHGLRETPVYPGEDASGRVVLPAAREGNDPVAAARLVHPYSVVPGGVMDGAELEAAAAADPVVREHYRGLNLRQARVEALAEDRYAYVSYRVRDEVYWTRNKLKLAKGETVITDGVSLVRARCGNRISDAPMAHTSTLEPPEITFNTPILPLPLRALSMPPAPEEVSEAPPGEKEPETLPPALAVAGSPKPVPPPIIAGFLGGSPPAGGSAAPPRAVPPPGTPGSQPATAQPPTAPPPGPPAPPPGTPPGAPPGPPPVTPPGTPPGTPSGPPPGTPSSPPLSIPPSGPPPETPAPPPTVLTPQGPEGPFPPGPPTPTDPPPLTPPDPLAPPEVPPPPPTPIPEPSTYLMIGAGLAAITVSRRRRKT
jgi:hypothetical protein